MLQLYGDSSKTPNSACEELHWVLQLLFLISHHQLDPTQTSSFTHDSAAIRYKGKQQIFTNLLKQSNCQEPNKFIIGDIVTSSLKGSINFKALQTGQDGQVSCDTNLGEKHLGNTSPSQISVSLSSHLQPSQYHQAQRISQQQQSYFLPRKPIKSYRKGNYLKSR